MNRTGAHTATVGKIGSAPLENHAEIVEEGVARLLDGVAHELDPENTGSLRNLQGIGICDQLGLGRDRSERELFRTDLMVVAVAELDRDRRRVRLRLGA